MTNKKLNLRNGDFSYAYFKHNDYIHQQCFMKAYSSDCIRTITNDVIRLMRAGLENEDRLSPVLEKAIKGILLSTTDSYTISCLYLLEMYGEQYCLAVNYSKNKYKKIVSMLYVNILALCLADNNFDTFKDEDLLEIGKRQEKLCCSFKELKDMEIQEIFEKIEESYLQDT